MLNYVAHAIEDQKSIAAKISKKAPESSENILRMISVMRSVPKFILPDFGSLLYDRKKIPENLEMTRLPYPKIIIEVPYPAKIDEDHVNTTSTKRIIIAEEGCAVSPSECPGKAGFWEAQPLEVPNAVNISVCSYYDRHKLWMFQPYSVVVMIGTKSEKCEVFPWDNNEHDRDLDTAGFAFFPQSALPEFNEELIKEHGFEGYAKLIASDIGTEIRVVVEMLTVLNCRNVGTEISKPSDKLNKARLKKGKEPFHEYHLLTVGGASLSAQGSSGNNDDDYKVRQHLRRGHIRRLSEDHRIWINQTVVAPGSGKGVSIKDYKVKSA